MPRKSALVQGADQRCLKMVEQTLQQMRCGGAKQKADAGNRTFQVGALPG